MLQKTISESMVTKTEIVLPNDTNSIGCLLGGRLLYWMDLAAAICAQNHAESISVTAAIDFVVFKESINIGNVVYINACVTRVFNTSMEVYVEVYKRDLESSERQKTNEAYFTFVSLNKDRKPTKVQSITFDTQHNKLLYEGALERRNYRLMK